MKKQKKQLILMLLLLVLLVVGYVVLKRNNDLQDSLVTETAERLFDRFDSSMDSSQVTELSYYYDGELCSLIKEDETWITKEDQNLTLKQSTINTMVSSLVATTIVSELENVTDLSEYGLAEPVNIITIKVAGTEYVVNVGNSNELTSYLYMQMEGSNTVYVVSSGITNSFQYGMDDLAEAEETVE